METRQRPRRIVSESVPLREDDEDDQNDDDEGELSLPLHTSQASQALPLASLDRIDGIGLWNGYEFTLAWAETKLGRWLRS